MGTMYLVVLAGGTPLFGGLRSVPFTTDASGRLDISLIDVVTGELASLPSLMFGSTIFIPIVTLMGSWARLSQLNRQGPIGTVVNAPSAREQRYQDAVAAARTAERHGWVGARIGEFPSGWGPSPWLRAHVALVGGDSERATRELSALGESDAPRWILDRPDRSEIGHLLAYVPPSAANSVAVLDARVHHGAAEDLVAHATQAFIDERSAEPLYLGAAGLAKRDMADEAMQWLERAVAVSPDPRRIGTERAYESLHRRSDFQQLLGRAERAAQPG